MMEYWNNVMKKQEINSTAQTVIFNASFQHSNLPIFQGFKNIIYFL